MAQTGRASAPLDQSVTQTVQNQRQKRKTTKVLLCAAAIAAACSLSTVAQPVVNHYYLVLHDGDNLFANQLDADGTGTNNTCATVFGTNVPINSAVYTWNGSNYNIPSFIKATGYIEPVPVEESLAERGWDQCGPDLNPQESARRH